MRRTHASPGTLAPPALGEIVAAEAPELFTRYESSPQGLSGEEAHRRLRRYGPNELPSPRPPNPLRLLFSQVSHTLALLLWAAARLARAVDLRLDYSILTGESEPVERRAERAEAVALTDAPNCVLAGTTVLEGTGEGIVFATAAATAFGSVAALTERLYLEPSPLQRELAVTARIIAAVAITIGVVFFLAGTATERLSTRDSFLFGVGILVAIIPEGLLPTVTLALALGVQRMGHRNAIIKRLSSVEALGSTNVICTDKTGTITINEMTARQLWAGDAHYTVTGRGYRLRGGVRGVGTGAEGHGSAPTRLLRRGGRGD